MWLSVVVSKDIHQCICFHKTMVWVHYNASASDFTSVAQVRTLPGVLVLPLTVFCFASSTKIGSLENTQCNSLLHNKKIPGIEQDWNYTVLQSITNNMYITIMKSLPQGCKHERQHTNEVLSELKATLLKLSNLSHIQSLYWSLITTKLIMAV